jgi:GPH family glycoside/pentoside/hexuronide:cation symporter
MNVPYTALTPELTRDYHERTSLNAYRFGFSIVSGLLAAVLFDPIVKSVEPALGESGAYGVAAAVWALVATLPFFFAFWGTYERHDGREERPMPIFRGAAVAFAESRVRVRRRYLPVSWLVLQTVATVLKYYVTYWLRQPDIFYLVILGVQGSATVFLFVWTAISGKIGKKRVYYLGMVFWIAVSIGMFAVQPEWPSWVIVMLGALAGVGVSVAYLVPWSMLPDVIELDELETGRRREGLFYGFFVFLQKFGLALGLFMVTQALNLAGYPEPLAGASGSLCSRRARCWMRLLMADTGALLLVGIALVYRFPMRRSAQAHAGGSSGVKRRCRRAVRFSHAAQRKKRSHG